MKVETSQRNAVRAKLVVHQEGLMNKRKNKISMFPKESGSKKKTLISK